jgi:hypothetical protein
MRKSRLLLAGVAVAAAGVATSAFTASNTVDTSVAGYGEAAVTGATVDTIHYVPSTTDGTNVDAVEFTVTEDVSTGTAILTLKDGGVVVGSPITCVVGAFTTATPIDCDTTGTAFEDFDSIGLTVVQ